MAISEGYRENFQTMLRASAAGHLLLMEGHDAHTGQVRYMICAVQSDGGEGAEFVPFGHLYDHPDPAQWNPYEGYIPPDGENFDGLSAGQVRNDFTEAANFVLGLAKAGAEDIETYSDLHPEYAEIALRAEKQRKQIELISNFLKLHGADL